MAFTYDIVTVEAEAKAADQTCDGNNMQHLLWSETNSSAAEATFMLSFTIWSLSIHTYAANAYD